MAAIHSLTANPDPQMAQMRLPPHSLEAEQAVLGDQVSVPTLDGPVLMKVPPGARAGKRLRLRGKGLHHHKGRGDEYVVVRIDIPEHLSAEEEKLYRDLASLRKGV